MADWPKPITDDLTYGRDISYSLRLKKLEKIMCPCFFKQSPFERATVDFVFLLVSFLEPAISSIFRREMGENTKSTIVCSKGLYSKNNYALFSLVLEYEEDRICLIHMWGHLILVLANLQNSAIYKRCLGQSVKFGHI